jgi:predicted nuclease of predicted toxin-antitoxin system
MKIVADACVDFSIVKTLRSLGLDVLSIIEESPSIPDEEVLNIAVSLNALLITEDKDFGELVFRLKLPHCGIILLRLNTVPSTKKGEVASSAILVHLAEFKDAFSVFDGQNLRIRR